MGSWVSLSMWKRTSNDDSVNALGRRQANKLGVYYSMTNIAPTCMQALHSPFLYPLSLEDFGQFVESSKAFSDVISLGGVIDPHLGLSVGQGSLKEKRDRQQSKDHVFLSFHLKYVIGFIQVLLLYLWVNDTFCEPSLQNFSFVVHLPDTWKSQSSKLWKITNQYCNI